MTETVNRIAGVWLDWQWAMLWQTAVLIGIVAVIDRLTRRRAWPQLRYTLWLLVLIKLVLPPTLASPLSVTSQVRPLAQKVMNGGIQARRAFADNQGIAAPAALAPAQASHSIRPVAKNSPMELPSEPIAAVETSVSWRVYVMGVWLAGVGALATGLCVRLRRLSKEHAASLARDVPDWFDGLVAQTAAELGLRRAPRVAFSDRVCCPAVFGVFSPVLLFPADSLPTTREETRHILLHELAHIRRGDLLVHAGYMILVTVYWINPLLWLIRKHIQNLRELCCDATVAAHLREDTDAYRETLLATGRALLARPVDPGLGLLGLFENSGWLLIRLQWLQKKTWRHPWLRRTSVAVVAILMLCCILPMASTNAADKTQADQAFRVTLPCGATMELIGIHRTGTDQWWRPDGTPLGDAPYDSSEEMHRSDLYEFALRYENLPEDSSGGIDIERHLYGGTIPMTYGQVQKAGKPVEGVTYAIAAPEQGTETTTVRVRLAIGSWMIDQTHDRSSSEWNAHAIGSTIFAVPYEREGRTYVTVTYAAPKPNEYDVRLTALDIGNVEHRSDYPSGLWTSAGFVQATPDFNLPLDDVVAFQFRIRPYNTWIEFRNVSLLPGKHQKVEIITTEPNRVAAKAVRRDESPERFSSRRDFSSQAFQAFHAACTGYLKQHPGSDLPKRPWSLKFRLPKQVLVEGHYVDGYVGPVYYVTATEYFRPGGYPSLKREDFESSEASRTPILYCKDLLKQEDGKGTNVLFGDGRVEYVTAEELDRLKATAAARAR